MVIYLACVSILLMFGIGVFVVVCFLVSSCSICLGFVGVVCVLLFVFLCIVDRDWETHAK